MITASSDRQRPTFRLKFEVNYSAVADQTESYGVTAPTDEVIFQKCGGHYATTFLTILIQLKGWLETLCRNTVVIHIDPRAVVQMLSGKRVWLTGNIICNVQLEQDLSSGKESRGG